jgi:hypothetical protein
VSGDPKAARRLRAILDKPDRKLKAALLRYQTGMLDFLGTPNTLRVSKTTIEAVKTVRVRLRASRKAIAAVHTAIPQKAALLRAFDKYDVGLRQIEALLLLRGDNENVQKLKGVTDRYVGPSAREIQRRRRELGK